MRERLVLRRDRLPFHVGKDLWCPCCLQTPASQTGAVSLPDWAGSSSVKSREGAGPGLSRDPLRQRVPSLDVKLRRHPCWEFWSVPREKRRPRRDCCRGAESLKIEGSPPAGAVLQNHIPHPLGNPVACTFLRPQLQLATRVRVRSGAPSTLLCPRLPLERTLAIPPRSPSGHRRDHFNAI